MEEKKILTQDEVIQRAKDKNLSEEELAKVSGGNSNLGWAWNAVYKLVSWPTKDEVRFIFSIDDRLKLWEFFGGGEEGVVVRTEATYSSDDGGWIDRYLFDTGDDTLYWCKRDIIVYND